MPYQSLELAREDLFGAILEKGASDMFLTAGKPPILRITKELLELSNQDVMTPDDIRTILDSLIDDAMREKFARDLVLDFSYDYKDIARFRINAYHQKGVVSLTLRYIPRAIPSLETLNLPTTIKSFANLSKGLVLFVSPKGSGKSTTIASLLNFINQTQQKRITTVERPIEYMYVNERSICEQREVGQDIHSAADALESIMRSGSDVVFVSHMDTPEVIEKTLLVAETGHLVFATLNTSYAAETVNWIVDLFPVNRQPEIRTRLAQALSGVVTQQLIPSLDERLHPATEILIVNSAVRNLIREGKTYQLDDVIATGIGEGMISLDRSLVELVKNGIVAKEEAISHVRDIPTFESLLQV